MEGPPIEVLPAAHKMTFYTAGIAALVKRSRSLLLLVGLPSRFHAFRQDQHVAVGQNQWYHLGVGAPPILEPILVGIGMFTGSTGC